MAISAELLGLLVCPACMTPVVLKEDEKGLMCRTCRRVFPIRDDIPVMLLEEARFDEGA